MQLSPETPKLPKVPFFVADAALLAAAALIFNFSAKPLAAGPLVAITICVALAAVCGLLPFILDYTRERDEELAKQQRALEALARTTAETAEQIGIAAAGLHTIAEQLKKSVAAAEHLPQQLQEKIAALDTRRAAAAVAEADALRAELAALRAAAPAKIEAMTETITRPAADSAPAGPAPRKSRAAQTLADVKTEPVASPVPPAVEARPSMVPATKAPAPAVSAADNTSVESSAPAPISPPATHSPVPEPLVSAPTMPSVAAAVAAAEAMMREIPAEEITETIAPFPMRPRPQPTDATLPLATEISAGPEQGMLSPPPRRKRAKNKSDDASPASAAAPSSASGEAAPTADSGDPWSSGDANSRLELAISDDTPLSPDGHYPATAAALTAPTAPPFPPRRTAAKSAKPAPEPPAPPPAADPAPEAAAASGDSPVGEIALSSDGLTRLIVTSYIGIGNKLFLRGDGPGLRPDVGVPLQFVSIGKWRWETADATAPMSVRLYKNDRDPCAAPADVTLRPGHQHEVSADF
jgi:hypothetical protein